MPTPTAQPQSPAPIEVQNPLTGEPIGHVPCHTPDDVRAAVERARAAQPGWQRRGPHGRARFARLWADALWQHRNDLIATIRRESGKNEAGGII